MVAWRCLIIEDDGPNAFLIAKELRRLGYHTQICVDGTSGLHAAMNNRWDVIVLDRMLPMQIDGLSIVSELRGAANKTPVLVLSALDALDQRVRGLRAGGDDYLTKPFALDELTARIEALIRRSGANEEHRKLEVADLVIDLTTQRVERAGRQINLQPREFRLLTYFMMHPHITLTRTMLLEAVWDYCFDPKTNVIDVQVSRLRNKIGDGYEDPLIYTERGAGYRMTVASKVKNC
jgi:two-component system OmpR family response regulator